MIDLNSAIEPAPGWTLTNAMAINNAGQIVGYGTLSGKTRAFGAGPIAPYGTDGEKLARFC